MKRLILSIAVMTALLGFTAVADAGTASTTLSVSATAVAACTVSTTAVNFGTIITGLDNVYANGDVTVNCPQNTPYHIAMDAGLHYDGFYRRISNGTNTCMYMLSNNNGLTEWGDNDYANTFHASSLADTGSGSAQPHTVYGGLSGIALPPGVYSDTVTVTVYY